MPDLVVVKVGGSLYDLPDLGPRLTSWLDTDSRVRPPATVILIPGGGATTDVVRTFDRMHHLGEEKSHWLALRALSLNAHFLAALLSAGVVDHAQPDGPRLQVLDPLAFCRQDQERQGRQTIPHTWDATSDAIAARVAVVVEARRLVLLKSESIPRAPRNWEEAVRHGFVDPVFPSILQQAHRELAVSTVNLRACPA
jgi:aspartokinase-like uncharacterized kinase